MQPRIALTLIACGVAVFLVALYGAFGFASLVLAGLGLAGAAVGLACLIFSLRTSVPCKPNVITFVLALSGIALHTCEQALSSSPFSVGWLLWALAPYAICLVASTVPVIHIPSIAGAAVVLILDSWVHYEVFVAPSSSTAVLALVFVPLWSSLVFAPLAMLIAWRVRVFMGLRS